MAIKKTITKKNTSKKTVKESSSKKVVKRTASKKVVKRTASKKPASKKTKTKPKAKPVQPILKNIISFNTFEDIPEDVDCVCIQKKPKGKFYNFRLQEGRWVQASAIPFPTKEICEEACC